MAAECSSEAALEPSHRPAKSANDMDQPQAAARTDSGFEDTTTTTPSEPSSSKPADAETDLIDLSQLNLSQLVTIPTPPDSESMSRPTTTRTLTFGPCELSPTDTTFSRRSSMPLSPRCTSSRKRTRSPYPAPKVQPRRSSFLIGQPADNGGARPAIRKSLTTGLIPRAAKSNGNRVNNGPATRRSRSPSPKTSPKLDDVQATIHSRRLSTASVPILPTEGAPTSPHIGSLSPTPAATIDWLLPTTRRQQYEEIDRSCSGLRGWWRKHAPAFCRGIHEHSGFYDGQGGDASSVRRYRQQLSENGKGRESLNEKSVDVLNGTKVDKAMDIGKRRRWSLSKQNKAAGKYHDRVVGI